MASFLVLSSILLSAVLILGVWRFFKEHPFTGGHSTTQTIVQTPPVTATPIPAPHRGAAHRRRPNPKLRDAPWATSAGRATRTPPISRPVINNFRLSTTTVERGASAELTWSVDDAKSVTIEPGLGTFSGGQGSQTVSPTQTTTYRLIANGPGGSLESTATLTVSSIPAPAIVSFEASPATLSPGQRSHLQWNVTGRVNSVSLEPGFSNLEPQGSVDVSPNSTLPYTLRVEGPGGLVTAHAIVQVDAPLRPAIVFEAQPTTILQGETTVLHWDVPDATRITIQPGGVFGNGQLAASIRVKPLATTTYFLTAQLPTGPQMQRVTVVVNSRAGPSSGDIIWTGQVHGVQLVAIDRDRADVGVLQGSLPGIPCIVQPLDEKRVSIASAPGPRNNFDRLLIRVSGNGLMRVIIKWSVQ